MIFQYTRRGRARSKRGGLTLVHVISELPIYASTRRDTKDARWQLFISLPRCQYMPPRPDMKKRANYRSYHSRVSNICPKDGWHKRRELTVVHITGEFVIFACKGWHKIRELTIAHVTGEFPVYASGRREAKDAGQRSFMSLMSCQYMPRKGCDTKDARWQMFIALVGC